MAPPPERQQQLLGSAIAALREGRARESRQAAAQAVALGADNASIWGVLAMACRDLGDLPGAQSAAERSIAHEPRNPRAFVVKGDVYHASGNARAAAAFYSDALKFASPQNAPVEMREELQRAQTRVAAFQRDFEDYLDKTMETFVATCDADTRRMREALDILCGRRQVYHQQPRHFLFPGLTARGFYEASAFSWVRALEASAGDIRAELGALLERNTPFSPYLTASADRPAYDNHGMADNSDWGAFYLWRDGQALADNQALCPKTTAAIKRVPLVFSGQRCPSVLFSRLKAGARIPAHTGMINTRLIAHLALIVPEGCGFRVGNDSRPWVQGKVWLFDDTIEHEAWNRSDAERIILIFEVWKPELSEAERAFVSRILQAVDDY